MMHLTNDGEPYVYHHECAPYDKGQPMSEKEKREFLISVLMSEYKKIYAEKAMFSSHRELFEASYQRPWFYPDITITGYHGVKGMVANLIVVPKGKDTSDINPMQLSPEMRSGLKLVTGSVFCLEEMAQDKYVKGRHYVVCFKQKTILPHQENKPLPEVLPDRQLAEMYADCWRRLSATNLYAILDKDFHYATDKVFDEMSSREEYHAYMADLLQRIGQFSTLQVEVVRIGMDGPFAAIVRQHLNDGQEVEAAFVVHSKDGWIKSVRRYEMDRLVKAAPGIYEFIEEAGTGTKKWAALPWLPKEFLNTEPEESNKPAEKPHEETVEATPEYEKYIPQPAPKPAPAKQKERIFVSYKRADKEKVLALKDRIERQTGLSCWVDLNGIESDDQFVDVIIKAINKCEVLLFMYSHQHSLIQDVDNDWTIKELSYAQRKNKRIVFINVDGTPLSDWFDFHYGERQQIDGCSEDAIGKLCLDLQNWFQVPGDCAQEEPKADEPKTPDGKEILLEVIPANKGRQWVDAGGGTLRFDVKTSASYWNAYDIVCQDWDDFSVRVYNTEHANYFMVDILANTHKYDRKFTIRVVAKDGDEYRREEMVYIMQGSYEHLLERWKASRKKKRGPKIKR